AGKIFHIRTRQTDFCYRSTVRSGSKCGTRDSCRGCVVKRPFYFAKQKISLLLKHGFGLVTIARFKHQVPGRSEASHNDREECDVDQRLDEGKPEDVFPPY